MNIHTRTVGDAHILDISGKIILGQGTMVVRNTIKDLLHNGVKKIVLNLAEVNSELLTYTQEPWNIADFPDMGADHNLSAFCDDACDPTG
jgi:hypothetical protein